VYDETRTKSSVLSDAAVCARDAKRAAAASSSGVKMISSDASITVSSRQNCVPQPMRCPIVVSASALAGPMSVSGS
jgi:hypothetical protein